MTTTQELSPALIRGLTNRIAGLGDEISKLRAPAIGGRQPSALELRAADLAETAANAARAALDGRDTKQAASDAMLVYTDYLDANQSVQRFLAL